jgi:four helix bundle protein
MTEHLPIERTKLYGRVSEWSDKLWFEIIRWPEFAQNTIGRQLIRSFDSVGANLVEGDGRAGSADSIRFFVIARASARESAHWVNRASVRKLMPQGFADSLLEAIDHSGRAINRLIQYRRANERLRTVSESRTPYSTDQEIEHPPDFDPFLE